MCPHQILKLHEALSEVKNQTLFPIYLVVNRIKELHKVTVRIPPDNEKSNLIRIEGDPQGVQEAKKELLELASRMVSTRLRLHVFTALPLVAQ